MLMGKVVGNVVSTRKNEKIIGSTILEIRLMENRQETDKYIIAIDSLGAGIGETVLVTTGSSAGGRGGRGHHRLLTAVALLSDCSRMEGTSR